MSENPYQPSQVAQGITGQSIGLQRIVAIAAAYSKCQTDLQFYGFRLQTLLWILSPIVWTLASFFLLQRWLFADHVPFWLFPTLAMPWFIPLLIAKWNSWAILSPRRGDSLPQQAAVISDSSLFVSGMFTLKESPANYNRILRFINRLINGRGPIAWFIRIPCQIQTSEQQIAASRVTNPFDDEPESTIDDDPEYWYAAGKLDPQKEPELVYQHLGMNSDPAVKIHYFDEQQRSMWLVLASPDAGYIQQTLATLPQSFMITLGH